MSSLSTLFSNKSHLASIRNLSTSSIRTPLRCRAAAVTARNVSKRNAGGTNSRRDFAYASRLVVQRDLKCKAAPDVDDVIDVEGREIDDRIPVTVSNCIH